jgi:hypothetical protein
MCRGLFLKWKNIKNIYPALPLISGEKRFDLLYLGGGGSLDLGGGISE